MSQKKCQKYTSTYVSEWRLYILTCSMQKYFTFYSSLQQKFPILLTHLIFCQGQFQIIDSDIKQRWSFEKSLSTFQPFTYVSNERYLINEMCIEGFPQRLESRIDQFWHAAKAPLPKNLKTQLPKKYSDPRDWSMIVRMKMLLSVISCLTQRWCSAFIFHSISLFRFIFMHWLVIVYIFCHVEK